MPLKHFFKITVLHCRPDLAVQVVFYWHSSPHPHSAVINHFSEPIKWRTRPDCQARGIVQHAFLTCTNQWHFLKRSVNHNVCYWAIHFRPQISASGTFRTMTVAGCFWMVSNEFKGKLFTHSVTNWIICEQLDVRKHISSLEATHDLHQMLQWAYDVKEGQCERSKTLCYRGPGPGEI